VKPKPRPSAKAPSAKVKREAADIPVDADRLRKQFPALTEDELAAYVTVTRSIMTAENRAAVLRGVITRGREAQDRGGPLKDEQDKLAVTYLDALSKIQGPTTKPH
jgi:hypothetical protein